MVQDRFPSRSYGINSIPQEDPNEILAIAPGTKLPGGVIYDPALTRSVRTGQILARNSLTGLYLPIKATEAAALAASGASEITVKDAHPFVAGDVIAFGGTANDATIASVNYDTNVITIVGTLSANVADNEAISVEANDVGVAVGIAAERWNPTSVVSSGGKGSMYIAGTFKKWRLYGLVTAASSALGGSDVLAPEGTLYRIG